MISTHDHLMIDEMEDKLKQQVMERNEEIFTETALCKSDTFIQINTGNKFRTL